jgi:hypothetical protein
MLAMVMADASVARGDSLPNGRATVQGKTMLRCVNPAERHDMAAEGRPRGDHQSSPARLA